MVHLVHKSSGSGEEGGKGRVSSSSSSRPLFHTQEVRRLPDQAAFIEPQLVAAVIQRHDQFIHLSGADLT